MSLAAWIPCPCCPEFWCVVHGRHAFECACPPIEEWETDPYSEQPGEPGKNPEKIPATPLSVGTQRV